MTVYVVCPLAVAQHVTTGGINSLRRDELGVRLTLGATRTDKREGVTPSHFPFLPSVSLAQNRLQPSP